MVCLALHGTDTTDLPEELDDPVSGGYIHSSVEAYPRGNLPMLLRPTRVRNQMILVVLIDEVLQHRTTLEDLDFLPILILVGQRGNATIRIDLEEPRLLLLVLEECDLANLLVWRKG